MTTKLSRAMEDWLKFLFDKRQLYGDKFIYITAVKENSLFALATKGYVKYARVQCGKIRVDFWKITDEGITKVEKSGCDEENIFDKDEVCRRRQLELKAVRDN